MSAKVFIGLILLLVGAYTIILAFGIYELPFVPSKWIITASGAIVAIYSLKYFKFSPASESKKSLR